MRFYFECKTAASSCLIHMQDIFNRYAKYTNPIMSTVKTLKKPSQHETNE